MPPAKKKILCVITKATWGGAQRYVFDLATNLPRDQYEVVVAAGSTGQLAQRLTQAGIRVISIDSLKRDLATVDELRAFFDLMHVIRAERPDVVHLNSSKAGALGALAARLAGVRRIVFAAHGWPFTEPRNVLWRALAWLGSYATVLFSHTVICVSRFDLAKGQQMPLVGKKCVLIHNGIDLSMRFTDGGIIRAGFRPGAKITGTIGELNHNKNHIALLRQAKADPSMYVAIVGEGELRHELEQEIAIMGLRDRVKLFGYLPAANVLKGFDIFALPSIKEGLPYVLLEAKLVGLPIDAPRIGGVPDILDGDLSEFSLERMLAQTIAQYR